ncbi:MAG: DUF4097 family beta strand repeat-containing protein [Anaerolineae bacterium]
MSIQEYPVGSECAISIESTACDITVTGVDQPQVVIETQNQEECHVVRNENRLQIIADPQRCDNLAIAVPTGCTLVVSTVSGDMKTSQLAGDVTLKTMSGDVAAHQITGHLNIRAVSGDVAISRSATPGLAIETVSGDISLESALAEDGEYSLHTISGDIRMILVKGQRCTLRYQSLSGDFTCSAPHEVRRQGWGKAEAAINGGGVAITCNSTSGDLVVRTEHSATQKPAPLQPAPRVNETRPPSAPFTLNEGTTTPATPAAEPRTRMEVLKAIEEKSLSVADGLAKLQALDQ